MSGGIKCKCDKKYKRIAHYKHNHSAFNGYHKTYSNYSSIVCINCLQHYRTKAEWVENCKSLKKGEYPNYPELEVCN